MSVIVLLGGLDCGFRAVGPYSDPDQVLMFHGIEGVTILELGRPYERVTEDGGDLICVCRNTPQGEGFYPWSRERCCYLEGDVNDGWDEKHYRCDRCGRIIDQTTLLVVDQVMPLPREAPARSDMPAGMRGED